MRAEDIPFMKLTKASTADGRVAWKREPRRPLTKKQQEKLTALKAEEAKKLPTEEKRLWFYNEVQKIKEKAETEKTALLIDRKNLLRDSFEQFETTTDLDLRGKLCIYFMDEMAEDVGGVTREWFSVITEELFSASLGLFRRANTKELSYVFDEGKGNARKYLEFAGKVFAKAVFERVPVKCYLNRTILNQLLGNTLEIQDLKYFDEELWNSVSYITTAKTAGLDLTFTAREGTVELKPNGKAIPVTDKNKKEFCKLFADYLMIKSTSSALQSFLNGFYSLVPKSLVGVLDVDELELFLCGDSGVDVEDWKKNTTYKEFYNEEHQVIVWFWEILYALNDEERRKLLQFCTGSTRVPAEGFKGLLSNNGKVCSFCIEPKSYSGLETSFIVAHTCFNRIELPMYPEKKVMESSLKQIISNPECYGFTFK
eukprot:TRINITY_DN12938_c0_g1_i4.p1 TRINITY_DN12938_c0_g1~~TRINITY_DN12938_c0_g1_i4.p1  ORF type:complete len:427 (+),score=115.72 TRINITY_DN12938_c0_g1_i4:811-2091(+)